MFRHKPAPAHTVARPKKEGVSIGFVSALHETKKRSVALYPRVQWHYLKPRHALKSLLWRTTSEKPLSGKSFKMRLLCRRNAISAFFNDDVRFYPTEIFNDLMSNIDPGFTGGSFASAACSGENDKTVCIAPGQYLNGVTTLPLIAVGSNNATVWNYPHSVFENVQSTISLNCVSGELRGASCSGSGNNSIL